MSMKTIFITGIAGFIGSNLARGALDAGYLVRGLDDLSTGREENLIAIADRIVLHRQCLGDVDQLPDILAGVDYVLHHAAIASVPKSLQDPLKNHEINATGTLNLLLACRTAGVKRVIFASSSSVYGDRASRPARETDCPDPLTPYAASKLAGENYMKIFSRFFGVESVCLRYFNVFGPRQDPTSPYSGVLALFIEQMLRGQRPVIYGDGEQTRDFVYVQDVVRANLRACSLSAQRVSGKVFNIASGRPVSLNQIYAVLRRIMGFELPALFGAPRAGDIRESRADVSAAAASLGIQPSVTLEEGLRRTISWYRSPLMGHDGIAIPNRPSIPNSASYRLSSGSAMPAMQVATPDGEGEV